MSRSKKKGTSLTGKVILILVALNLLLVSYIFFVADGPIKERVEKALHDGPGLAISSFWNQFQPSSSEPPPAPTGEMRVHVIDVGQGSATLLETGDHAILIDAGDNGQGVVVAEYLKRHGITKVDLFVSTHPHADHIGGMDELMEEIDLAQIIMPALPRSLIPTSRSYLDVLESMEKQGKTVTAAKVGDVYLVGEMSLTILAPSLSYKDLNNMSVVSRVDYGSRRVLITGDAEKDSEKDMLGRKEDLHSDIYIAGHHGSSTSSTEDFLDMVNPSYVAISCGLNNDYGHPHKEVLRRLEKKQIPYYRTDLNGTIIFTVTAEEIKVEMLR